MRPAWKLRKKLKCASAAHSQVDHQWLAFSFFSQGPRSRLKAPGMRRQLLSLKEWGSKLVRAPRWACTEERMGWLMTLADVKRNLQG